MWKNQEIFICWLVILFFASASTLTKGERPDAFRTIRSGSQIPTSYLMENTRRKNSLNGTPKQVIGCGVSVASEEGGSVSRIYGGVDAVPNEFPWQALVSVEYSDGMAFGGGSLINEYWVLTAGHLTFGGTGGFVQFGSYDKTVLDSGQVNIYISELITHPQYQGVDLNDIGLIKLSEPAPYTDSIRPICLPNYSEFVGGGVPLIVSGWGLTSSGSLDILQKASVTSMTTKDCAATGLSHIDDTKICTTAPPGTGTCSGDSGGPLTLTTEGKTYSVGITSFAINECGGSYPNGFTRTTAYLTWISATTGIGIDP